MTKKEYMDMYDVVGAAMEVYNTLGRGMAEAIYQESLAKEFKLRGMDAEREKPLYSYYKGVLLDKIYYADFYYKDIVIELKSVEEVVVAFNEMNENHDYFIETMEREELADFIHQAARLAGLDIHEEEDITEEWREW